MQCQHQGGGGRDRPLVRTHKVGNSLCDVGCMHMVVVGVHAAGVQAVVLLNLVREGHKRRP